jgi:hypothetical protein
MNCSYERFDVLNTFTPPLAYLMSIEKKLKEKKANLCLSPFQEPVKVLFRMNLKKIFLRVFLSLHLSCYMVDLL